MLRWYLTFKFSSEHTLDLTLRHTGLCTVQECMSTHTSLCVGLESEHLSESKFQGTYCEGIQRLRLCRLSSVLSSSWVQGATLSCCCPPKRRYIYRVSLRILSKTSWRLPISMSIIQILGSKVSSRETMFKYHSLVKV